MSDQGFAKIRNGIRQHYKQGKFSPSDLGIYLYLHLECNWSTGVYHGSALGIAYGFDNPRLKQSIQRSLARLRENGYINFRKGDGTHKGYDILINKFEPQGGKLSDKRLNAWKNGDKCLPFYEEKTDGDTEGKLKSGGTAAVSDTVARPIPEVPELPDRPELPDIPPEPSKSTAKRRDQKPMADAKPQSLLVKPPVSSPPAPAAPVIHPSHKYQQMGANWGSCSACFKDVTSPTALAAPCQGEQ